MGTVKSDRLKMNKEDIKTEKLADQEARDLIEKDLDTSYFVEAGAGSGKTESMSRRLVALVADKSVEIENIAAITFTRKAAAELRERFQQMLEAGNLQTNSKVKKALNEFERASIGTVHSFCAGLLRERPVEAGVDPGFEELEESDDKYYAKEVWDEYISRQYSDYNIEIEEKKFFDWISDHGLGLDSAKDTYLTLINYPDVTFETKECPHPDMASARKVLTDFLQAAKKEFKDKDIQSDKSINKDMRDMLKTLWKQQSIGYLEKDSLLYLMLVEVNNDNEPPKKSPNKLYDLYHELKAGYSIPAVQRWQEHVHKPLLDFALNGTKYYAKWRKERSLLNFQDLLMKTAELLRENKHVRDYFKERIKYLLVDEFQDTDPIQAEIIMLLTGQDSDENVWYKLKPKPGALFLVGDPKQSIYRFRRADIRTYNSVRKMLKENLLELTVNFRSGLPIQNITNKVFEPEFGPGSDYQAKYTPMNVKNNAKTEFNGIYYHTIQLVYGHYSESAAIETSQVTAKWIKAAIDGKNTELGKCNAGDFLILARKRGNLSAYAKELENLGIPYDISGGKDFKESEEIGSLITLLNAVIDYKNQVAIVSALRGIFFGISDQELYEYSKDGGEFGYIRESVKGHSRVNSALAKLKELKDISNDYAPLTAIYLILEKTGIIPYVLSGDLGVGKAGNIFKAMDIIREKHKDSIGTFAEMVERLIELREAGEDIEESSMFPEAKDAVRIMNVHKAKGLQSEIVILVDPSNRTTEHKVYIHVERGNNTNKGYIAVTRPNGIYHREIVGAPLEWDKAVGEAKKYEAEEEKRLEYVAVTRAKKAVLIFLYPDKKDNKDISKNIQWRRFRAYALENGTQAACFSTEEFDKTEQKITKAQMDKRLKSVEAGLNKISESTYVLKTVSDIAKGDAVLKESYGEGAAWGRVVHRALKACGDGKRANLDALALNWLIEENLDESRLAKLLKHIDVVMQTEHWHRVKDAEEKYFEMPFTLLDGNMVVTGAIDLVYKHKGEWYLVDWKTDDFKKDAARHANYKKQVEIYAKYWREITGEKVNDPELMSVL